jgi:XTP/dITP diphosphohydrolase
MSLKNIVIASSNKGKLAEFDELFSNFNIEIIPQNNLKVPDAVEDGLSFIENAIIKARNACAYTSLPSIADDSGLEVDALSGAPGIYSARFSENEHGQRMGDTANNMKLLSMLEGVDSSLRGAQFVCALAFMRSSNDPSPVVCVARWRGIILENTRGDGGFGYDPLFYLPEYGCTSAELSSQLKNQLSHRGQALKILLAEMSDLGLIGD